MKTTLEATRLGMGKREVYLATAEVPAAVQIIEQPSTWDALSPQPHGNRVRSKDHVAGIVEYLRNEENPILNALVVYPRDVDEVAFVTADGFDDTGQLELKVGTTFDVGDGQHRLAALAELVAELRDADLDDPLRKRIYSMKIPLLIVRDTDQVRRAQDFVDLQRNAKAPAGSLGASMDRRHAINRFTVDVAKRAELLDAGKRIEFLSDTVGKKSSKLYSFQAFRQAVGILLVGSAQRTRAGWESSADEALTGEKYAAEVERVVGLLNDLAHAMPGWAAIIDGSETSAEFREQYLHATAAGLYAIALSVYTATKSGVEPAHAIEAIASIDWHREPAPETEFGEAFFDGTLVVWDVKKKARKTASGRPSWEGAADKIVLEVVEPAAVAA